MDLKLERIELREIVLPLKAPFETSFGRTTRRRILIVKVINKDGATGYGECVAGENPFFNHETIDTAWLITAKYIAPMLAKSQLKNAVQPAAYPNDVAGMLFRNGDRAEIRV